MTDDEQDDAYINILGYYGKESKSLNKIVSQLATTTSMEQKGSLLLCATENP
jgi:hypothetical protein